MSNEVEKETFITLVTNSMFIRIFLTDVEKTSNALIVVNVLSMAQSYFILLYFKLNFKVVLEIKLETFSYCEMLFHLTSMQCIIKRNTHACTHANKI